MRNNVTRSAFCSVVAAAYFGLALGCAGDAPAPAAPSAAPVASAARAPAAAPPFAATPDAPFRSVRPAPLAETSYVPPLPAEHRLPNGLRVLVIERHDLPIVSAALVVEGGAVVAPHLEAARASVVLLERGTAHRSAATLASAFDALGATRDVSLQDEVAVVSAKIPSAHLAQALGLLAEEVLEPAYAEDELALYRDAESARTREALENAEDIVRNLAHVASYPAGHPYARGSLEHLPAIAALRRDDVVRARQLLFDRGPAALVLVGDVHVEELSAPLEALGRWPRVAGTRPKIPPAPPLTTRDVWLVDRPGATQSLAWCNEPGVTWTTPDRQALRAGNAVLGGFWMSRLNAELREKRGISYWVSSQSTTRRGPGLLRFGGSFQREHTGEAVTEMLRQARTLVDDGLTVDELRGARTFLLGDLTNVYETDEDAANDVVRMLGAGLPLDSDRKAQADIRAITGDAVSAALRAHIHPAAMRIVVVGDRATVEPQLREAKLGDVSIRDAYGAIVK